MSDSFRRTPGCHWETMKVYRLSAEKNSIHQFHAMRREGHRFMSRSQHRPAVFPCEFHSSYELVQTNRPGRGHAVVHVKKTGFVNLNALRHSPDTWWSSVCTRTRIRMYGRRIPSLLRNTGARARNANSPCSRANMR